LLEIFHREWPVIKQAPYSFFISVVVLAALIWAFFEWRHRKRLETIEEKALARGQRDRATASVDRSGNSNANASGNSLNVLFPPFSPPPPVPEVYSDVNVGLEPSQGQFDKMYLRVINRSDAQVFQAQCSVIARRNDPNPPHLVTFPLNWEHPHGRALQLLRGESGNLLIAGAGEDRSEAWIKLESASSVPGPESRWSREARNERLPEYDLEITILGQQSKTPQSERFSLSAGINCAFELYKPTVRIMVPDGIEIHKREYLIAGTTTIPSLEYKSLFTLVGAGILRATHLCWMARFGKEHVGLAIRTLCQVRFLSWPLPMGTLMPILKTCTTCPIGAQGRRKSE
jgi:hypothetical protein